MSSSVSWGAALWQDGPAYSGQQMRKMDVASTWFTGGTADALQITSGVINNSVGSLQVLAVSGMTVKAAAGFAIVANSTANTQSGYKTGSMTSSSLTVTTADATNPRIDLVCVTVNENGDSTSIGEVQIIAGTPAGSPVAPSTPSNSLALATIAVAANASSISQGNITDQRAYTTAAGGVIPYADMSLVVAGHPGLIAYDVANDRFFHNGTNAGDQFKILPWAPVYEYTNSSAAMPHDGSYHNLLSASITVDGSTDIKVTYHIPGHYVSGGSNSGTWEYDWAIFVDGTQIDGLFASSVLTSTVATGGFTSVYSTSSASGDTPAAGSHTVYMKIQAGARGGADGEPYIQCSAVTPAYLRVEPVTL